MTKIFYLNLKYRVANPKNDFGVSLVAIFLKIKSKKKVERKARRRRKEKERKKNETCSLASDKAPIITSSSELY